MIEIIAYHGWAFDSTFWNSWEKILRDDFSFKTYERGYFLKESCQPAFSQHSSKVILVHSLGLHLCPVDQLVLADLLVIFNGFIHFHPVAAQFRRRSRLIVQKMIKKFQDDPEAVLEQFMENAFQPYRVSENSFHNYKQQVLLNDLKYLNTNKIDNEILNKPEKICILHGSKDQIVPKSKGREIYDITYPHATYFEINDAGHAMPITHTEECWSFISPKLENVLNE